MTDLVVGSGAEEGDFVRQDENLADDPTTATPSGKGQTEVFHSAAKARRRKIKNVVRRILARWRRTDDPVVTDEHNLADNAIEANPSIASHPRITTRSEWDPSRPAFRQGRHRAKQLTRVDFAVALWDSFKFRIAIGMSRQAIDRPLAYWILVLTSIAGGIFVVSSTPAVNDPVAKTVLWLLAMGMFFGILYTGLWFVGMIKKSRQANEMDETDSRRGSDADAE
jgi:hypothetical protein